MKKWKIEIKWALIFIASLMAWMFLERLVGLHDKHLDKHQYLTLLYSIIAVSIYVFALNDKRRHFYNGTMSYLQGFLSGLVITSIVTVFSPLTQWVISNVITPDYFKNVIEYSLTTGYHKSRSDALAQFNYKSYAIQSTIGALVMGLVTTAVVAIFKRKKGTKVTDGAHA